MAITVDELVAELGYEIDTGDLDRFKDGTDQAEKKTISLRDAVKLGGKAIAAMGAAAAAAVVGLASMTLSVADEADAVAKMSKQLNVSSTDLQRLGGAAQLTGGDITTLQRGMRTFATGLADAKTKGTGPAIEGLYALGLSVEDLEGLLNEGRLEDALGVISDSFNATGESAEKNAALAKLFGRAGQEIRPLLAQGSEGIRDLGDQIDGVLTPEQLEKFEEMNDDLFKLERTSFELKAAIAEALAPEIGNAAEEFRAWIKENDDLIKQDIPDLIRILADAARDLVPIIVDAVTSTVDFVKGFKDLREESPLLDNALKLVGFSIDTIVKPMLVVKDAIVEIVDLILTLTSKIPGLERVVMDFRRSVGLFDGAQGPSAETEAQLDEWSESYKAGLARDRRGLREAGSAPVIGGLSTPDLRKRRTQVEVIEEKIQKKIKLTRSERKVARELGLLPGGGGGGGGGGGKSSREPTINELLGIEEAKPSTSRVMGQAGGGAKPLSGATFTSIDASVRISIAKIDIDGTGITDAGQVADSVYEEFESRFARRIYDHNLEAVKAG